MHQCNARVAGKRSNAERTETPANVTPSKQHGRRHKTHATTSRSSEGQEPATLVSLLPAERESKG